MSRVLLLVIMAAALATACKRGEKAPVAQTAAAETNSVMPRSPRGPGSMPDAEAPAVIADTGDTSAVLDQLSAELRRYVISTRSVPKNFEDFAAKSKVQFPAAPAGKKYAIKSQQVVLVKK